MGTTHRRAAAALSASFRQSKNKENNKNRCFKTAGCEEGNQLAALWCQWGFFCRVLYGVICAGQSGRKGTEHRVILWWHLLLISNNLGEIFSDLLWEERGCKGTAVREGREGGKAKLEKGKSLVEKPGKLWHSSGNPQKNATEISSTGKEIRDDMWSTILAKDRIMDILAGFICVCHCLQVPRRSPLLMRFLSVSLILGKHWLPELKLKYHTLHFYRQTFISVFRGLIASFHLRHILHPEMSPVRSYSVKL